MASLISRLKNLGASSIAKGIVGTMMLKVASAIIAFSLFSLAANAAGAEEFGKFSVFFSVASMMSIVAAAGQELKVVRAWNQYMAQKQPALALGAVRYGWILTLVGTAIVAVVFGVFLLADLAITPLQIGGDWLLALATIAFMATNTIALFTAHLARAIVSIQVGDGHHELTWRSLVIAILLASLIMGHGITTTEIFAVSALGLMLVIAIQTVYINRKLALDVGNAKPDYDLKTWNPRSFRLWLASIMEASNQHLEVFMIGVLLHPLAAGAYFVASRLANAFALAADGINTFGTRRVPGLYFAGEKRELSQSLRLMALMSLAIVVGGVGTVLIAGDWLLLIFGRDYMAYYWVLVILSVGTAISAAVGPAPAYLKLTGHEAHYMSVVSGSVILRIIGFIVIIPYFGIIGAAIVTASILAVMSLYLNYQCRKQTGMDPSILCLFRDPVIEPTAKENASPPPEALAAE
jgi:O-antigen/teichoic acid export membrane protein